MPFFANFIAYWLAEAAKWHDHYIVMKNKTYCFAR